MPANVALSFVYACWGYAAADCKTRFPCQACHTMTLPMTRQPRLAMFQLATLRAFAEHGAHGAPAAQGPRQHAGQPAGHQPHPEGEHRVLPVHLMYSGNSKQPACSASSRILKASTLVCCLLSSLPLRQLQAHSAACLACPLSVSCERTQPACCPSTTSSACCCGCSGWCGVQLHS